MFEHQMSPSVRRQKEPVSPVSTSAFADRPWEAGTGSPKERAEGFSPGSGFDFGAIGVLPPEEQVGPAGGPLHTAVADRIQLQQGGGVPMEPTVQRQMETEFGHNFADVRIHADGESDALNQNVGANAFTLGSDIFLSREATGAGTYGGDRTLAHELTHVVQQRGAGQGGPLTVSAVDDPEEQEASAIAANVDAENPSRPPHVAPSAQASVAPLRVQRDGKGVAPPSNAKLQEEMDEMKLQIATLQKQQAAVQLDLEWRAKFGQKMASYKQAVWRITGGIDAADKGFQDAQVAQAQEDQIWAQVIGVGAAVLFAGGFEWVFGGALGALGVSTENVGEELRRIDTGVARAGEGAATVSLPGRMSGATGTAVERAVEKAENPANALVGGYMTNIRSTGIANESAQRGQTPAITGGGAGAMAFLAQQSEQLEKHTGDFEGAFAARAEQMKKMSDDEWVAFDVDAQAKIYEGLFASLDLAGRSVENLQTPEMVAGIIECHLWAAWIKGEHLAAITQKSLHSIGGFVPESIEDVDRAEPNDLHNFGNAINERLIFLGVEAAAHTGLYTHWWEMNADGWQFAVMNWARGYHNSVAK